MIYAAEMLTLKTSEALAKDIGRGIVRIDPDDMKLLGLEVGDIAEIIGKRKTAAKVMPSYADDRGNETIQLDGILRENALISIGERIQIQKANSRTAQRLTLTPIAGAAFSLKSENDSKYVGSLLQGIPLVEGDRVRTTLISGKPCDFRVSKTSPEGVVLVSGNTQIKLDLVEDDGIKSIPMSYEEIGGLGSQLARIREMVELPLRFPEVFKRLGIDAPKGVLLYGPPGTGKTLIARAVASETDAYFTSISAPEIMGKLYGESESRLRKVFEDAKKHAPAIIFIDEIDAIAPKREGLGDEKQVEKRVVAQLLSLMDGISSRGQIVVIGATNIPNALDPALRRPGRFDRELSISIPDKKGRLEILTIHTRAMPLAVDVNLEKIAAITHGFVGADLAALAREAAMSSLRTIIPSFSLNDTDIAYELLLSLEVKMEHFIDALREVEPSAIREFFVEIPDVKWNDVGGLDRVKEELKEAIELPIKFSKAFQTAGATTPKGILLHGKPGSGKTLLAKAVASETGVNFISASGSGLLSRFIGESEKAVRDIFRAAKQAAPTILFIDEIDALIPKRSDKGSDTIERVVSQFLIEMDGIENLTGVILLGATNRLDLIDEAMLRGGRFDLILEVPLPDLETRVAILNIHTKSKPIDHSVSIDEIASSTEGFNGADLELICKKAATLAIRDHINASSDSPVLNRSHFNAALHLIKTQKQSINNTKI